MAERTGNASDQVTIERKTDPEGDVFIISDEGGEFARATTIEQTLHYAGDLLYGPATHWPKATRGHTSEIAPGASRRFFP